MTEQGQLPWLGEKKHRVAVIGDLMLDEYLEGQVSRISPEAPVPVHLVKGSHVSCGGAANVALNVAKLGGQVSVFGVIGQDEAGATLVRLLEQAQVHTRHMVRTKDRHTIKKTRVSASRQQLVRIDWEASFPITQEWEEHFLAGLSQEPVDVIILSDYGKGCLTSSFIAAVMSFAKRQAIPVIVDPKGHDFSRYEGATLITPNRLEALQAIGFDATDERPPRTLLEELLRQVPVKGALVTLGDQGMIGAFRSEPEEQVFLSAVPREVFDVSGAGDTVVALMALGLSAQLDLAEAMKLANAGAGMVVEKWGTQPLSAAELVAGLSGLEDLPNSAHSHSSAQKMVTLDQLLDRIGQGEGRRKKVVFTNGCFDILHAGHVSYLEKARQLGDLLVVGVNSDQSVKAIKGSDRPFNHEMDRMTVLAALGCVSFVVLFSEETPLELIKAIGPQVLVKGADYQLSSIVGAKEVLDQGGAVKTIDLVAGRSSSRLIDHLRTDKA